MSSTRRRALTIVICGLLAACQPAQSSGSATTLGIQKEDPYARDRRQMVRRQLAGRDIVDKAVLEAMGKVPRHLFVPPIMMPQAYRDHPLPIGRGQTISQPYIVALMSQVLDLKAGSKVLEVGTGSGYQAAVLAEMGMEVYSIEIVEELANSAARNLAAAGYERVSVKHGDGYLGWPERAPFQAVIVTAAPDHLPQPLVDQLGEGGRLVIPIGPTGGVQSLRLYEKKRGKVEVKDLIPVRFVPLTRLPR